MNHSVTVRCHVPHDDHNTVLNDSMYFAWEKKQNISLQPVIQDTWNKNYWKIEQDETIESSNLRSRGDTGVTLKEPTVEFQFVRVKINLDMMLIIWGF